MYFLHHFLLVYRPPELEEGYLIINTDSADTGEPIVRIFASYDMGWSQRGNGYTYDSLNGYCALIGLKSGKVLDYCTRNRKCRICDTGARSGVIKKHDCRLNFSGSAKAMEADGAVELVTKSAVLKNANIQVGVFIGDNDSCCISSIQKESNHTIIKQSDMNHSNKGVGNILHELHKSKISDPDSELSNDIIKHIQRCFTYAIHQNKGNVPAIKVALENIPYHLYDHHDNCGTWCNNKNDAENGAGIRLKNNILFEVLKNTFCDLSANAEKFASAASSQPNESLNNSMCSKAPKNISYSTSESADYRFAATVAQKNCGTDYITRVLEKSNMSWSSNLTKYVQKCEVIARKKKDKSSLPSFKKRRLDLKAAKSQLRNRREKAEGEMYKSNMGLLDTSTSICDNDNCIQVLTGDILSYESDDFAIVFFDIETGGLSPSDDILQISMKCRNISFTSFITPVRPINPASTKVTGLSKVHKKLFQYGKEVHTLPRKTVFVKILKYLHSLNKKCILVAHNCSFDSLRLVLAIQELSLLEQYQKYVKGFSDSLALFRRKFPNRKNGYKLTTLATELLDLSCVGAHDAKFDVMLLENLCTKLIDMNEIITTKTSIESIVEKLESNQKAKELLPSFEPMKSVISAAIQKRLASYGICYETIVQTFKTKGIEETKSLLRGEVDKKPKIIKTKKILNSIIDYLIAME